MAVGHRSCVERQDRCHDEAVQAERRPAVSTGSKRMMGSRPRDVSDQGRSQLRSLDPTGRGRQRWAIRWKPALNAFALMFEGRIIPNQ
jgi:hypothetical protein